MIPIFQFELALGLFGVVDEGYILPCAVEFVKGLETPQSPLKRRRDTGAGARSCE
jgi:hypothetical protein